jgi:hypothetical protein
MFSSSRDEEPSPEPPWLQTVKVEGSEEEFWFSSSDHGTETDANASTIRRVTHADSDINDI